MSRLNPPLLEGKVPSQYGNYLKIPFSMNKTVNLNQDYLKIGLIVKTISTGIQIISNLVGTIENDYEKNTYYAIFDVSNYLKENKIISGQFYQIQLCFVAAEPNKQYEYGYYSSLSIMKYTKEPIIKILNLNENYFKEKDFVGSFSSEDSTEKVYSYEFVLMDSKDNIVETSGVQIHNNQLDTDSNEIIDFWSFNKELDEYEAYYLIYRIITNNGLKATSPRYKILETESVLINFDGDLINKLNSDEAYVSLYLRPFENQVVSGSYILSRTDSTSDYKNWEEIYRFSLNSYPFYENQGKILIWEDYTCQHGVSYRYGLQAYNNYGLYSEKLLSNDYVKIDFEDIFLFDGDRQLKVQFNPKISSYKINILETKTNTLGGKYPFIFRNGIVNYKEFQLSGLISFLMDQNKTFMSGIQFENFFSLREETPGIDHKETNFYTNLSYDNIYYEQIFREEVFKWLTNGKPKLFRSPTEGNCLISLSNTTLTPNDTVGRMLYTFNSTAYEIDDSNLSTLKKYGFSDKVYNNFNKNHISITQIVLQEKISNGIIGLDHLGFNAFISNAYPGSKLTLWFSDGDAETIEIGKTGNYYVLAQEKKVIRLKFENELCYKFPMKLTYCYYSDIINNFSNIKNIEIKDIISQFIGETDLITDIQNEEKTILKVYFLEIKQRPVIEVFENNGKYYFDKNNIYPLLSFKEYSKDIIFKICDEDGKIIKIYDCNKENKNWIDNESVNFSVKSNIISSNEGTIDLSKMVYEEQEFKNEFNRNFYLKSTSDTIYLKNIDALTLSSNDGEVEKFELSIGNGLMMNICYQLRTIIYDESKREVTNYGL